MRRGIACSFLTVLGLAACVHPDPVVVPITIAPVAWLAPAPGGSLAQCQPVHAMLVREVPTLAVPQAVAYLTVQSSMPLDAAQMKQMLPASDIDRLVIAETSAIDAEDEADRREAIAADPVLSNPAYRQAAQNQRIEAAVRREAQPTLQPYLIRGLQAREAAGGYAVCRAADALQVTHVSNLGGGTPELWFKPLVVLLPAPPGTVYVGTAAVRS
ncbi:MAG: hypothetical protein JWO51_1034 [Rhodospirillales bacterium]|nr:hypothetical protein [Rhodospirillales bacterium]